MAVQPSAHHHHAAKTLGESAVCLGCALAILAAAAVGMQWLLHLLP
jgi:hypothetical protein